MNKIKKQTNRFFNFKKYPNVVKLFGNSNIELKINEFEENISDSEEKRSKRSDSSHSLMDLDVVSDIMN